MTVDLTAPMFHDEDAARAHLEGVLWPRGPFCPHCGSFEKITRLNGRSHRAGLHQCNACQGHFTVTNGTVMERSHIPLSKWVLGFHLMAASKKGVSAHQLHRMLKIGYRAAWFMEHRIREAMTDHNAKPLGGEGRVIEADELYHGKRAEMPELARGRTRKPVKKGTSGAAEKREIFGLVERGGHGRMIHMSHITAANLKEQVNTHASRSSRLHTDESKLYNRLGTEFAAHETVNHGAKEYVRGDVTTNTIEGMFGIFVRGMTGVYQHCGEQHLQRYLNEFSFRWSYRVKLGIDDTTRAAIAIKGAAGKRLTYRGPSSDPIFETPLVN